MNIYYENHIGQRLDLSGFPYLLSETDIFDFEWDYVSSERGNYSSRITRWYRNEKKPTGKIVIHPSLINVDQTGEKFRQARDMFFEVTERDVLSNLPGKLVLPDGEFLQCFIRVSQNELISPAEQINVKNIEFISSQPFWYKIISQQYYGGQEPEQEGNFKKYPYNYDYNYYGSQRNRDVVINNNISPADFVMRIYGYAQNPVVTIGQNLYGASVEIPDGSYLEIDTINQTLQIVDSYGRKENVFYSRNIYNYIFEQIQEGENQVSWMGDYRFDIDLYQRRSEPRWSY